MRFIKSIARKTRDLVENQISIPLVDLIRFESSLNKDQSLLGHFLRLFLTHCPPQNIRTTQRVSCQHLRCILNLLLIDHNTIGVSANFLKKWMFINRVLTTLFNLNHLIDVLHRTRTIERQKINNIFNPIYPILPTSLYHSSTLKLKNTHCLSCIKHFKSCAIFE